MPVSNPRNTFTSRAIRNVVACAAIGQMALITPQASAAVHRLNSSEAALFKKISSDPGQQRRAIKLDPILCKVARKRATDMARNSYFGHLDLHGRGPNYLVKLAGYTLPSWYDQTRSGNNIESIVMAGSDPGVALNLWKSSTPHRVHVLGTVPFYREQDAVGVGSYTTAGSGSRTYFVFLSAPQNLAKQPPQVTLKNPAGRNISSTR